MLSADHEAFLRGIAQADIVSPNLHEAQTMYEIEDELEIMRRMLADGVEVAALRMGELGSLLARSGDGQAHYIPAVAVDEVVDQTGAGNTYCGGFLVGYCRERDIVAAGCYGAAAASFTLEYVGCARIPANLDGEWARRLALRSARWSPKRAGYGPVSRIIEVDGINESYCGSCHNDMVYFIV